MPEDLTGARIVNLMPTVPVTGPSHAHLHYCAALRSLGAEVEMWALEGDERGFAALSAAGVRTRLLGLSRKSHAFATSRALTAALTEAAPDFIHAHCHEGGLHASRAIARGAPGRLLITHHDSRLWRSRRLWTRPYRLVPERVIFPSEGALLAGRAWYGYPEDRVALLPHPVDCDAFRPRPRDEALLAELGLADAHLILLWTARLHRQKGHADLLRAAVPVLARHPRAALLFVGEGKCEPALRNLAAQLGIAERVIFAGKRGDVPALLSLADIFVCPSHTEALSQSLQEAMAAARPIVSTTVWGAPDHIRDGESGLLVPIGAPEALAAAIIRLAEDLNFAARLGSAARAHALERLSPERFVAGLAVIYAGLPPLSQASSGVTPR